MKAGGAGVFAKDCPQQSLADAIRRVHSGEVYCRPSHAETCGRMQKPSAQSKGIGSSKAVAAAKSNKEIGAQLFSSRKARLKLMSRACLDKLGAQRDLRRKGCCTPWSGADGLIRHNAESRFTISRASIHHERDWNLKHRRTRWSLSQFRK